MNYLRREIRMTDVRFFIVLEFGLEIIRIPQIRNN